MTIAFPQAQLPATAEAVLTFLESVGKRSEAELYLKMFLGLPKESFALVALSSSLLRSPLGQLVESLHFLADLGLVAPVVVGMNEPESSQPGAERLVRLLDAAGLKPTIQGMAGAEIADNLREQLRSEKLPVLYFPAEVPAQSGKRIAQVSSLIRELDSRKFVLVRRRGGLRIKQDAPLEIAPGHVVAAQGERLSMVNLRSDYDLLSSSKTLVKADQEILRTVRRVFELSQASQQLLASVTSPLSLLKELFTVKGAGTLIKLGSEVSRHDSYQSLDLVRLKHLLESSFGRPLSGNFFAEKPLAIYIEAGYRGAAILHAANPAPYLGKFSVLPDAQGEGIGRDLWEAMTKDHPAIFWRSRPENPITPWYTSVCDGMARFSNWHVFWRGLLPTAIPLAIADALGRKADFAPSR